MRVLGLVVCALFVAGCYSPCDQAGTPLMWGLMSQQPLASVRSQLQSPSRWVETRNDYEAPPRVPRFDFTSVEVGEGEHLGHRGPVTLTFYNDRLYSMSFQPSDLDAYMKAVEELPGADVKPLPGFRILRLPPRTEVWKVGGYVGPAVVEWYDECLREEHDSWISQYA
jgi:hypothetical protein